MTWCISYKIYLYKINDGRKNRKRRKLCHFFSRNVLNEINNWFVSREPGEITSFSSLQSGPCYEQVCYKIVCFQRVNYEQVCFERTPLAALRKLMWNSVPPQQSQKIIGSIAKIKLLIQSKLARHKLIILRCSVTTSCRMRSEVLTVGILLNYQLMVY